ncbi:hypothetical protein YASMINEVIRUS_1486 [Yasminevirus sp. GU-2018]|uniref:Uncharacterized protein n=1 Tax=Yasminevirus sp. GU-2018 TaxID=2420051 RepID=A0A5K0UBN7_9VIRU|nr:hypothetical protein YASMINEVIRUS_1486 [Yasminevirus sp. GU-2018]
MGNSLRIFRKNKRKNIESEFKINIPKSDLSNKPNRKDYDLFSLSNVKGTFGTIDEPSELKFVQIPINPNLSRTYSGDPCRGKVLSEEDVKVNLQKKTRTVLDVYEIGTLVLEKEKFMNGLVNTENMDGLMLLFYSAYANHGSVFLRPDDVFLHFLQQIGCIIDKNPEEMRKYFVDHEGKKNLTVVVDNYDKRGTKQFVTNICKQMEEHVKEDVVNTMTTSYSTSAQIDSVMNRVACMTNMRHYFEYTMTVLCGIRSVYFGGSLNDWIKLRKDISSFEKYGDKIESYVNGLIPILDEFILARQGKPDVGFFNRIFREDAQVVGEFEIGYGYGSEFRYITGWILDLYHNGRANYNRFLPHYFKTVVSTCPFVLDNNGATHNKILTALSIGVQYHNLYNSYSLVKGWCAGDQEQTKKREASFDFD